VGGSSRHVIKKHVDEYKEPMGAQTIGNELYGLHNRSRGMVELLKKHVDGCKEPLNIQELGNGLYGLHKMSSE
jgi:hypothetical protein